MNTTPEHIHAVVNHVPLFAAAFALLPFVHAIVRRSSLSLRIGLVFLIIGAGCMVPTILTGESAEHRVEAFVDPEGKAWLDLHEDRSEPLAYTFYVIGAVALAGLVTTFRTDTFTRPIALGFFVISVFLLFWVAYVADSGGKIRHPEFREGTVAAPQHRDHHD
jgi:cell division protein FtsW (lipid II flippase)